jgi:hypothetical protein
MSLRKEMGNLYSTQEDYDLTIELPRLNQPCAVPTIPPGDTYSRGKIVAVTPGSKTVTVLLVDEGRQQDVSVDDLRLLPSIPYMRHRTLGINVELHGVRPDDGRSGDSGDANLAKIFALLRNNMYLVFVHQRDRSVSTVTLYQQCRTKDVCINALVVHKGWATATTIAAQHRRVEYFKENPDELFKSGQREFLTSETLCGKTCHFGSSGGGDDGDGEQGYQPSKVLRAHNPSKIFIMLEVEESVLMELRRDMLEHYGRPGKSGANFHPEIGTHLAVFDNGNWDRGILESWTEDGLGALVSMTDLGVTNLICRQNMKPLHDNFSTKDLLPLGVFCHLRGIKPANGEGEWSQEAIDRLRDMVKWDGQLMAKFGEETTTTTPDSYLVSIKVKVTHTPGPLEPTEIILHDIARQLVAAGVAEDNDAQETKQSYSMSWTADRWLPPKFPPAAKELSGTVSYVDKDALFYIIRPSVEQQLAEMRRKANCLFEKSNIMPHDRYW